MLTSLGQFSKMQTDKEGNLREGRRDEGTGKANACTSSYRRRPLPLPPLLPPLASALAAAAAAAATASSDFGVGDDRGHIRTVRSHPAVSRAESVAARHEIPPLWPAPAPPAPRPATPITRRLLPLPPPPAAAPPPENLLLISPVSQSHSCIVPSCKPHCACAKRYNKNMRRELRKQDRKTHMTKPLITLRTFIHGTEGLSTHKYTGISYETRSPK